MTSPAGSPPPAHDPTRREWENRILGGGEEPDPRFTLANERTFLAWTRTSLAFLAGGIALAAFPLAQISDEVRTFTAIFVVVIGLLISAGAAMRWLRVERAMRHGRPLPIPGIVPFLSLAAVCACVLTIVMLF
jgi:putative membrane protein